MCGPRSDGKAAAAAKSLGPNSKTGAGSARLAPSTGRGPRGPLENTLGASHQAPVGTAQAAGGFFARSRRPLSPSYAYDDSAGRSSRGCRRDMPDPNSVPLFRCKSCLRFTMSAARGGWRPAAVSGLWRLNCPKPPSADDGIAPSARRRVAPRSRLPPPRSTQPPTDGSRPLLFDMRRREFIRERVGQTTGDFHDPRDFGRRLHNFACHYHSCRNPRDFLSDWLAFA